MVEKKKELKKQKRDEQHNAEIIVSDSTQQCILHHV